MGNGLSRKRNLEEIVRKCDIFQRFQSGPIRFRVSLPNENEQVFGKEIYFDLMFIYRKAIIHIIDTATHFYAASFLYVGSEQYGQSIDELCLAFAKKRCTIYSGYHNLLRTDQGSVLHQTDGKN